VATILVARHGIGAIFSASSAAGRASVTATTRATKSINDHRRPDFMEDDDDTDDYKLFDFNYGKEGCFRFQQ
jgi:hypothetical protein